MQINVLDFAAKGNGTTNATKAIQAALDAVNDVQNTVVIPAGVYLVGSLFVKSHTSLVFEDGAVLLGTKSLKDYKIINTRVAGIEMKWPAAIINCIDAVDISISGNGRIDGQGPFWWAKYWGNDKKNGARKQYDEQNLRWIADYSIPRPREILLYNASDIKVKDINLTQSGFWNLQITYCSKIEIANLVIDKNNGPSTDGIDIDSSEKVHVHNCVFSCGDDCIAIKSGRDGDGYRVGRPSRIIEIDHCKFLSGYGLTIGSEVTGSVYEIKVHDLEFVGCDCGIRMKSSAERGGAIENVFVENLQMKNVRFPFSWILNWHREYNLKKISDEEFQSKPEFWRSVAASIPKNLWQTKVRDVYIKNVSLKLSADYEKSARAFDIKAFPAKPMENIIFEDIKLDVSEFGNIVGVKGLKFKNVSLNIKHSNQNMNDNFDNR
jgi:polygalacturonase